MSFDGIDGITLMTHVLYLQRNNEIKCQLLTEFNAFELEKKEKRVETQGKGEKAFVQNIEWVMIKIVCQLTRKMPEKNKQMTWKAQTLTNNVRFFLFVCFEMAFIQKFMRLVVCFFIGFEQQQFPSDYEL